MRLYEFFRSPASFRVRIVLNLKNIEVERHFVDLARGEHLTPQYRALHPQGFVPLLIDGATRITQSLAICEYLNEKYPTPPLLPDTAEGRAFVRAVALTFACDLQPLVNRRVFDYLRRAHRVREEKRRDWYAHWMGETLAAVEQLLSERAKPSRFSYGGTPTLADVFLVPQVASAAKFGMDLDPYPLLRGVYATCMKLSAFNNAQPSRQPDAPKKGETEKGEAEAEG